MFVPVYLFVCLVTSFYSPVRSSHKPEENHLRSEANEVEGTYMVIIILKYTYVNVNRSLIKISDKTVT